MSTISSTSSSLLGSAATTSSMTAAQTSANSQLQEAAQSLISGSTGNSSMDVSSLVTALVNAKVAGTTAELATQQTNDNTKLTAIGTISAALSALQAGLGSLANGTLLSTFTATPSGTGLTATAGTGAVAGAYDVNVQQLATAQSISSGAFNATTGLGTGTLTVSVGGQSANISINSSNNTLSGIASAINSASNNPGVTATVITGTNGAHLVLRSTATGAANTINVSVAATTDNGLSKLGVTSAAGTDASTIASSGALAWTQSTAAYEGSAQSLTSGDFAAGTQFDGTLTVAVAGSTMNVNVSSNSALSDVASAINSQAGSLGVSATVQTNTDGTQHLVLTSTNAGAANTISVGVTDSGSTGSLANLGVVSTPATLASSISSVGNGWSQSAHAQDALFTVDGTSVASSSNTSSTAITGVSLSLTATGDETLTVAPDTTSQASAITNFVSQYNALVTAIGNQTVGTLSSGSSGTAGPLMGDSLMSTIQGALSSIVAGGVKSGNSTVSLASIGITLNADGTLSTDSTKLNNVLQNTPSVISSLFNSTTGIGAQMNKNITSYTDVGGLIDSETSAINTDLSNVSTQQTALATYTQQLTDQYNAQFTALNTLMAQMNSNAQYLTQLFGGQNSAGALATNSK